MKKFYVFCLAALIGAACTEKNVNSEVEGTKTGFPYTITATFEEEARPLQTQTRVNFTDPTPADPASATWSIQWKVGDEIHVANQVGSDNTVVYVVKSISAGVATFELKEGEDVGRFDESTTFFAMRGGIGGTASDQVPHAYICDFDGSGRGGIRMGLPTYKSIMENTIDNDFFLTVAKATLTDGNLSFRFRRVISYLMITIPDGMTYDVGELYVMSNSVYASGFFNVRMNASENTIDVIGGRISAAKGGSPNSPFWYGTGSTQVKTKPYPTFPAGVYYLPVFSSSKPYKIIVYDTEGTAQCTREFSEITLAAGKVFDFGTIPTTADD